MSTIKIKDNEVLGLLSNNYHYRDKSIGYSCFDFLLSEIKDGEKKTLIESVNKLIEKAFEIIKDEAKKHKFNICVLEINLSLFEKPYVHIWLKDYDKEKDKVYKIKSFFGEEQHPCLSVQSNLEPFILNFKPF